MKILTKIMNLLQLFINSFSSFTSILSTFIKYSQNQVQNLSNELAGAGVFANIIVPPAFLKSFQSDLATGGFNGFIQRLTVSLYNSSDVNAPHFSSSGQVGGFIILLDTPTLSDFYKGMNFLNGMFDFMNLFPINTDPPPPRNLRGAANYYKQPDGNSKLGVKLDWDAPVFQGFTNYKIFRSTKSGGVPTSTQQVPTKLIGPSGHEEEGLLTAAKMYMFGGDYEWPTVTVNAYNDPTFNGGSPVVVPSNTFNGSGTYYDFDVDTKEGKHYYYVVQSGFSSVGLWGPNSPQVGVTTYPAGCISQKQQAVVPNSTGVELLSAGAGSLGQWSAIQAQAVLPFVKPIMDLLNGLLSSLGGSLKTNSKAFSDFLTGIVQKFEKYQSYITVVSSMITALETFFSGAPKIAFLEVSPATGGIDNFINRVKQAQTPSGGFSGPSGYTMGVVFVYGENNSGDTYGTQIKEISAAFSVIQKCLGS
jgi:hypothetical protein